MKAIWKGTTIAESNDTVVVEGNHYFPTNTVNMEYMQPSDTTTVCPWKGVASYYSINVDGELNTDAAWYLSLIHISEPTRLLRRSRMPSSA